jgi:hypothetical protein
MLRASLTYSHQSEPCVAIPSFPRQKQGLSLDVCLKLGGRAHHLEEVRQGVPTHHWFPRVHEACGHPCLRQRQQAVEGEPRTFLHQILEERVQHSYTTSNHRLPSPSPSRERAPSVSLPTSWLASTHTPRRSTCLLRHGATTLPS